MDKQISQVNFIFMDRGSKFQYVKALISPLFPKH